MPESIGDPIYRYQFTISIEDIDGNGHVNNVRYIQWMQDAAVRHYAAIGGVTPMQAINATWVVRSHHIEYLSPAFAGDQIEVRTWVANLRRVRSLRCYEFYRPSDGQLLARGETDWVLVHASTGRPLAIPNEISRVFTLLAKPPV